MSNPVFRFATVQGQGIHWFLKRNCSVTPVQLGWMYASLVLVSLNLAVVEVQRGERGRARELATAAMRNARDPPLREKARSFLRDLDALPR